MVIKFLRENANFLCGWTMLLSMILVFQVIDLKDESSKTNDLIDVTSADLNPVNEEVKSRFFPLMFFYSK